MPERPSGAELLEVALKVLRERLLPRLPADCRYEALMVANAIGIAAREAQADTTPLRAELQRLAGLYHEPAPQPEPATRAGLVRALETANRRLARDIRAGSFSGPERGAALRAHLRLTIADQLAVSNPKVLGSR